MAKAARITADLIANTSQFEEGFKRAGKQLLNFGNIAKVTLGSQLISGAAHKFVDALKAITTAQFHAIEEQGNLARSLGITTREFQALSRVAKESGVDQGALANAIGQTQKAIIGAAQGNDKYERSLAQLNLSTGELLKLSPDKQFETIAVALSKVQNATQRTVLAQQVFGKTGRDLIPMITDIAAKLADATAFNDKFGLSLSEIDVEKVRQANDTFGRVKDIAKGLGNQIAIQLAPAITGLGEALLDAGFNGKDFGIAVAGAIDFIAISIDNVRIALLGLETLLGELLFSIDLFVLDASKAFFDLAKAIRETLEPLQNAPGKAELLFLNINQNAQASAKKNKQDLADLEKQAGSFVSVYEKLQEARVKADADAAEALKKAKGGNGPPVGIVNEGNAKTVKSIMDGLREESDQLKLQATLYGKKEGAAKRATEALKIQNKLAAEGITLTRAQSEQIDQYLDDIARQTDLNNELADAEQRRQQALSDLGSAISSSFEDALINGEKLGDVLDNLGKDIERIITRLLITGPLEESLKGLFSGTGTSSSSSGGGIFGKLLSFLPSFAVGANNIPHDMIAQLHKGETVVPAYDAAKMRKGSGSGDVNLSVKIVDNAGVKVSQQASNGANGPELMITLDKAQADNMTRKGSASNQALMGLMQQSIIRRS